MEVVSDKHLFNDCGILAKVEPGDGIMVDKGFAISNECKARGCHINI